MSSSADAGGEYFDEAEFSYRATIEDSHYWHVHRRHILLRELSRYSPASTSGTLLEIGCGIGTVATFLNENGYSVDYAEYFDAGLEIARRRARSKLGARADERLFARVDVTSPLTLEKAYGGIMMLDVIEHLPDDLGALRNVRGALGYDVQRGGAGFVMISVPAFQFLWSPWDDVEKHKRRYTQRSLAKVLDDAGFKVERMTYFFAPLFFAALGMKTLRMVKDAALGHKKAGGIQELTEGQNVEILNRVMVSVLSPERSWLPRRSLPFGTSILAFARAI